jgi:hypothetical protein
MAGWSAGPAGWAGLGWAGWLAGWLLAGLAGWLCRLAAGWAGWLAGQPASCSSLPRPASRQLQCRAALALSSHAPPYRLAVAGTPSSWSCVAMVEPPPPPPQILEILHRLPHSSEALRPQVAAIHDICMQVITQVGGGVGLEAGGQVWSWGPRAAGGPPQRAHLLLAAALGAAGLAGLGRWAKGDRPLPSGPALRGSSPQPQQSRLAGRCPAAGRRTAGPEQTAFRPPLTPPLP